MYIKMGKLVYRQKVYKELEKYAAGIYLYGFLHGR